MSCFINDPIKYFYWSTLTVHVRKYREQIMFHLIRGLHDIFRTTNGSPNSIPKQREEKSAPVYIRFRMENAEDETIFTLTPVSSNMLVI